MSTPAPNLYVSIGGMRFMKKRRYRGQNLLGESRTNPNSKLLSKRLHTFRRRLTPSLCEIGRARNIPPRGDFGSRSIELLIDKLQRIVAQEKSRGWIFGIDQRQQRFRSFGRIAGLVAALGLSCGADRVHYRTRGP